MSVGHQVSDIGGAGLGPRSLLVIARIADVNGRVRITKLCSIARASGLSVTLWKLGDSSSPALGIPHINITRPRTGRLGKVIEYCLWLIGVALARSKAKDFDCIWCVGLDAAVPLGHRIRSRRVVFDNADNASLSYRMPAWIRMVVERLEAAVALDSRVHVVPSRSRWAHESKNLRVLPNLPSRSVFDQAKEIAGKECYKRPSELTIYVNGWLKRTRGLGTLLGALEIMKAGGANIRILVAGEVGCKEGEQLVAMPACDYFGVMGNAEALALYWKASVAFTFYDPSIAINRVAEPNKWGDCLATRTPFLCNDEISTAGEYVRQGVCLATPYDDAGALAEVIRRLDRNRRLIDDMSAAMEMIKPEFWDEKVGRILAESMHKHDLCKRAGASSLGKDMGFDQPEGS